MDTEKFINEYTMLNEVQAQLFSKSRLKQLLDKYAEHLQLLQSDVSKSLLSNQIYTSNDMFDAYRNGEKGRTYRLKDTSVILPYNYEGVDG